MPSYSVIGRSSPFTCKCAGVLSHIALTAYFKMRKVKTSIPRIKSYKLKSGVDVHILKQHKSSNLIEGVRENLINLIGEKSLEGYAIVAWTPEQFFASFDSNGRIPIDLIPDYARQCLIRQLTMDDVSEE